MSRFDEDATSRTLQFGEDTVHYHDLGEGPPLVLNQMFGPMPGTSAWMTYEKVIQELGTRYRCILLDFPNYGRSSPKVIHEPVHDVCARNAFAVMDELGIEHAPVVGVSMGATVAIDMALAKPDRVDRLVLGACHASTGGDPYLLTPFPSEMMRLHQENQGSEPSADLIRRVLLSTVYDPELVTDALVERYFQLRVNEPQHNDASRSGTRVTHSNIADLHKIDVPTLIVHGRFDRMVPYEQALMILNYIPSSDLVVLNRCGHWPAYERPAAYLRAVLPFLTSNG